MCDYRTLPRGGALRQELVLRNRARYSYHSALNGCGTGGRPKGLDLIWSGAVV
jgi:hypothetical protein